jgi:type IV secretion system protein VirD4
MNNDYTTDHSQTPYGSARWTDEAEIADAGLFKPSGLQIGYIDQKPLYQGKAWGAGHTVIAGAGAGKLTTHLAYPICQHDGSCLILDPKGELAAISLHNQVRMGKKAWVFNPYGLHDLPRHRLNPLDILKPDSPTLHADTATLILDLMPSDPGGGGSQKYWEDEGRRVAMPLLIGLCELQGGVSLADFKVFPIVQTELRVC